MSISVLDIFSISIGPSSSHTAGPIRAAYKFVNNIFKQQQLSKVYAIKIDLYGSLALTGKGHKTDEAIFLGLCGKLPETLDTDEVRNIIQKIVSDGKISLLGKQEINFDPKMHVLWHYKDVLPLHTNGMQFRAYDVTGDIIFSEVYYSIGGGFIVTEQEFNEKSVGVEVKYPFKTAKELWGQCENNKISIKDLMLANESSFRSIAETKSALLNIAEIMESSIKKGCSTKGILEGGLQVRRRASDLYESLQQKKDVLPRHTYVMGCVSAYALAVAEENASGGRIITAPTNGAAGIIPAVLQYYKEFCEVEVTDEDVMTFLLVAGAIAILYKSNASISGAEVGCQGEVGVACSMAAGALTIALGGSYQQGDKAAKIAMEHNLGLTCDPIMGLVQIPCIERNAFGASRAIDAAAMSLIENESEHKVSLDDVIKTMLKTGLDMQAKYKETSEGGLADIIC